MFYGVYSLKGSLEDPRLFVSEGETLDELADNLPDSVLHVMVIGLDSKPTRPPYECHVYKTKHLTPR